MDEADFIYAILLHPEDDTLRGMYADWLEDQGDERAEVLRAMIRVMQQPRLNPTPRSVKFYRLFRESNVSKEWLAQVSRGGIGFCFMRDGDCPRRWERLIGTEDATVRRCFECKREVWFCWRESEVIQAVRSGHRVVKALAMKKEA